MTYGDMEPIDNFIGKVAVAIGLLLLLAVLYSINI